MRRKRTLQPVWSDEILLNEDYAYLLRPRVMLLLELVDLDSPSLDGYALSDLYGRASVGDPSLVEEGNEFRSVYCVSEGRKEAHLKEWMMVARETRSPRSPGRS